jgi:hypothetical protein
MPRNAKSTPRPRIFQPEEIFNERAIQRHAYSRKRAKAYHEKINIIGRQQDGSIEGQKMLGETAAAPGLPLDIILPRL